MWPRLDSPPIRCQMSAPIVVFCEAGPNDSMASAARESVQMTIGDGGVGVVLVFAAVSGASCVSSFTSDSAAIRAKSSNRVLEQSFSAGTGPPVTPQPALQGSTVRPLSSAV